MPGTRPVQTALLLKDKRLDLQSGPLVMGVLNATPDSFSDGGLFFDPAAAADRAAAMIEQGAQLIDVGGESTRPGASPVSESEQIRRVIPVIQRIRRGNGEVPISIDTRSAGVAEAALESGADAVNDISALRHDERMIDVVRDGHAGLFLMHMQGTPATMQQAPCYRDVVQEVREFLRDRAELAVSQGIGRERIAIDPGIGFGKTLAHNLALLHGIPALIELDYPVLVGVSRKRFVGQILGILDPRERLAGTAAAVAWCCFSGAHIFRVHDVAEIVQVLRVCHVIRNAAE